MEQLEKFSIHDIRILRLIAEQAKLERKAGKAFNDIDRQKRLCFHHIEYVVEYLMGLMEEENEHRIN